MVCGAFEIFSRGTIKAIAPYLKNMKKSNSFQRQYCRDRPFDGEDVTIAHCLKEKLGLLPEPAISQNAVDVGAVTISPTPETQPCDYISVQQFNDYLIYNRTAQGEWWFWEGRPKSMQYGCLVDVPIGFHEYKRLNSLYELENAFYKNTSSNADFIVSKLKGTYNAVQGQLRRKNVFINANEYVDKVHQKLLTNPYKKKE